MDAELRLQPAVDGVRRDRRGRLLGPVRRIMPETRGLARPSAALSSVADAPRRRPPPPCSWTHQAPLTCAYKAPSLPSDLIRRTGPSPTAASVSAPTPDTSGGRGDGCVVGHVRFLEPSAPRARPDRV